MVDQTELVEPVEPLVGGRPEVEPTRAERFSLAALRVGAIAVVLAAITTRGYDLDRFFVPKEIVLHACALVAGLLAVASFRRVRLSWIDLALITYLGLGGASTLLAEDPWLAARALTISASGIAIFWTARALQEAGLQRPLVQALGVAVVVAVITSLAQTYGVETDLFTTNRAPGGTLGNRNSIAHMAAFGLPLLLLIALRARNFLVYLLAAVGVAVVVGGLVLTRSRAGWIAFAAVLLVFAIGILISPGLRRHGLAWAKLLGLAALIAGGVAAAVLIPNTLEWRSENPYLETIGGIANYQEGSGAGRIVQYQRTLAIAVDNPLLGVGPAHWPEVYPEYAERGDPSMSRSNPRETANPWPSSDWVAFAAERGFPALILLGAAVLGMGLSSLRRARRAAGWEEAAIALTVVAVLAATMLAGLFDAVLLLPHPTLIVWGALGALWSVRRDPPPPQEDPDRAEEWEGVRIELERPPPRGLGWLITPLLLIAVAAAGFGLYRSVLQLASML